MTLQEKILKAGIENCLFIVPMRPIRSMFGLINYTDSDDHEIPVHARINEKKYKVSDNYKITLVSYYSHYGKKDFYLSDLHHLVEQGIVEFYVKG